MKETQRTFKVSVYQCPKCKSECIILKGAFLTFAECEKCGWQGKEYELTIVL